MTYTNQQGNTITRGQYESLRPAVRKLYKPTRSEPATVARIVITAGLLAVQSVTVLHR